MNNYSSNLGIPLNGSVNAGVYSTDQGCERIFVKQFNQSSMPISQNRKGPISLLNPIGMEYQGDNYVFGELNGVTGYIGNNSLLKDGMRGQLLVLDRPNFITEVPVATNVKKDVIYDKKFNDYGKNYANYYNINGGQIQYYVDRDTADPYFKPVFENKAKVVSYVKENPMGVYDFYYDRYQDDSYSWNQCKKSECDSFTHDSLWFRQDLMALQQRKNNQQRWSNRWTQTS